MAGPLTAVLSSRTAIAPGIVDLVFTMVKPERLTFQAGQFVSLAVGRDAEGTVIRRSYSIASARDRGEALRFIIRIIEGGVASDYFLALALGDEVAMTGPHGFFVLDAAHAGDVVFCATGTGIAPVMSMLGELAQRPEPGRRLVYWGARQESDLFARAEIEALCAAASTELIVHLTAPAPGWTGARGRITQPVLAAVPELEAPTFYLVGNGAMIEELKKELQTLGVDRKRQIRTEAFF